MPRARVECHEIPIELGDHTLYLLFARTEKAADAYIKRKFKVDVCYEGSNPNELLSYFVGHRGKLFLFIPPDLELDYIVHEITHVYRYMISRMDTIPDEEGEAYTKQMIFKKILNKLVEIGRIEVTYVR